MLGWSMEDLAKAAGLSASTVKRMETESSLPISDAAMANIRIALERVGIQFLADTGEGIGLRLAGRGRERLTP
ncbi:MAG: helix-turn-helix domain-containing protein [Janthinobacterium lividum]